MGKQSVNIGSAPDDNTGDPIRNAFNKLNLNHDELYALLGNGTTLSISGDATMSAGAVTVANDSIDNNKLANITRGSVKVGGTSNAPTDLDAKGDGKILIGDGTDIASVSVSGDIAITNAGATTIQAGAVENSMLADNAVDHDELANRFTEDVDITTLTGAATFDCSTGSVFKLSGDITGTYTITLSNHKKGQIITIYPIKGNQTVNLSTASGTPTFNKIGGIDYEDDGSSSNILQIECVDDAANSVFFYSLATFTADKDDI